MYRVRWRYDVNDVMKEEEEEEKEEEEEEEEEEDEEREREKKKISNHSFVASIMTILMPLLFIVTLIIMIMTMIATGNATQTFTLLRSRKNLQIFSSSPSPHHPTTHATSAHPSRIPLVEGTTRPQLCISRIA